MCTRGLLMVCATVVALCGSVANAKVAARGAKRATHSRSVAAGKKKVSHRRKKARGDAAPPKMTAKDKTAHGKTARVRKAKGQKIGAENRGGRKAKLAGHSKRRRQKPAAEATPDVTTPDTPLLDDPQL